MVRFPTRGTPRCLMTARAAKAGAIALVLLALSALAPGIPAAWAQAVYPTPDDAANALVDSLARGDGDELKHVLGSDFKTFIPLQDIDEENVYRFLGAWAQGHVIETSPPTGQGETVAHLVVGTDGWTLPIPIVQSAHGWRFDPHRAQDEILTRRIGRNERGAMLTALAYIDAQNDYYKLYQRYAQRFISSPGQHDGLYWDTAPGEPESPLGPLAATMPERVRPNEAYHGYHYRILTSQGEHAPGGAQSYIENGAMTKGFGLVAWPAQYGATGVMSFMVNQNGQLYQKNLGPHGMRVAGRIQSFNPDASWQPVAP